MRYFRFFRFRNLITKLRKGDDKAEDPAKE